MNKYEIRNQILELVGEKASEIAKSTFEKNNLKNYHLLSANLLKFLPDISLDSHKEIYENILKIIQLENIHQYFRTFDLDNFFANLPSEKFSKNSPAIYISYHMGAYRTAVLPMVKNNVNIAIIIEASPITPIEELEKTIRSNFNLAKEIFPTSTSELVQFSSNDKKLVIELMDKMYKGFSILSYIDWNWEYNSTNKNVVIDFFNVKVSVSPSIAYLSFFLKCQIIPFITYYSNEYEPNWMLFDTIYPETFKNVNDYAQYAMQNLYTNLQGVIKDHYSQWKGWFHIHKSIVPQTKSCISENNYNADMLYRTSKYAGLFTIVDSYFVINKLTYKIIKLTKELYNSLFSDNCLDKNAIDLHILEQLYSNGIIERY